MQRGERGDGGKAPSLHAERFERGKRGDGGKDPAPLAIILFSINIANR
jgi:hypothetical protein